MHKTNTVAALLFIFLFWLAALHFPTPVAAPTLDPSWEQALGHAWTNHWQAGSDYLFTYGPLGALAVSPYNNDLFYIIFIWECAVKLGIAVLVWLTVGRVKPAWLPWLFLLLFVLLPANNPDLLYPLALFLVYLVATRPRASGPWSAAAAAGFCAVLSLLKFTLCVMAVLVVLAVAAHFAFQRTRRGRWLAAVPVTVYPLVFLGIWLAMGQAPGNLPAYFHGSWQLASGYSPAMALEGNSAELGLAFGILLAFVALLATGTTRPILGARYLTTLGLLASGLFFQWKHGFVRQDAQHTIHFFSYALCLSLLLPAALAEYDWKARPRIALLTAMVLLAALGVWQTQTDGSPGSMAQFFTRPWQHARHNLQVLAAPAGYRNRLEELLDERKREYALPAIAAEVGDASIDYFSSEPGILLLNHLNWRPRPAFQSYFAFTRPLLELNAAWYRGPQAPTYILLDLQPIDRRVPGLEDGPALLEILGRYAPVLTEKHFLLLKKKPLVERQPWEWNAVRAAKARWDEDMELKCLPGTLQAVTIAMRPSWQGKTRSMLYRPAAVWLRLRLATGETFTYRLIPAIASSRFLLNPLVQDNDDVRRLLEGGARKQVVALAILADDQASWEDEIIVTIEECRAPPPSRSSGASGKDLAAR